jgi:tetratricopeptide (TPR) repeat protein
LAANKDKLLESAQKFIAKGQIDRAIKDYQQVVALDPKDTRHRQKLAELLVRFGRNNEAVGEYEFIGKFYDDNGYYLKAIAVYKQIQKLTPDNITTTVILGSLNGKQGLTGNALDEYRTAVNYFEKKAQLADAVNVIEKMLELDPENPATCQKHAELLFARNEVDAAFAAYTKLAGLLKKTGNQPAAEKIDARMAHLFPDRVKLSIEDLTAMVKSDVDGAIGKLSGLIKQDSTNLPVWKLLIEAYRSKGDQEKLKLTYELVIRLFPGELFAREGIIRSALAEHRHGEALDLLDKHAASFLEHSAFQVLESLYLAVQEHSDDDRITRGLTGLYRQSGNAEKLSLLEKSLEPPAPPEELPVVEEPPAPVFEPIEPAPLEDFSSAAPEALNLAAPEAEEAWEEDVYLSIDDEDDLSAELEALEEEALPEEGGSAADEDLPFEEETACLEMDLATEAETLDLADEIIAEEELVEEVALADLILSRPESEQEVEDTPEGCEIVEDLEEAIPLELAEDLSAHEEPETAGTPELLELATEDLDEQEQLVLLPEEAEELPELSLVQMQDDPGEQEFADFDISKGIDQLFDKFEDTLTLDEPDVSTRTAKYSWDGMLSEQDGAASPGDAETHFDLGIAYKEMGLYDDAIAEFRRASISPTRKLDCITLQAACYREKGEYEEAEAMLLEATALQELTAEDRVGLRFELAQLYLVSGREAEALEAFRAVERANPDFPGVALKIASLEGENDSKNLTDLEYEEIEELVEMPGSRGQ